MSEQTGLIPIVIPAYMPGQPLSILVEHLLAVTDAPLVIVDDGSGNEFEHLFAELSRLDRVHVVRHAVNLGKGSALKTGMNYVMLHFPDARGAVTADADGQHRPEDILRVRAKLASTADALVMGVRQFTGNVPLRSRIGNSLTRVLTRLLIGHRLADTQTGLRGIPAGLLPHLLRMRSSGYEFELDMLIACRQQNVPIVQEPIHTVYLEGNMSSHFQPILDSMRIYFLLFRFSVVSLLTAVLDNIVFALALSATGSIGYSQIAGRLLAMTFNYFGARTMVFHSRQGHTIVLPKYVALVIVNGLLSYGLIQWLHGTLGVKTIGAKLLAEGLLFIFNFAIQRDFVFKRRTSGGATDWDTYYASVPPTAKLTRRYTTAKLLNAIKSHAAPAEPHSALSILEIGGANSCFVDSILGNVGTARYDVVDTNHHGLEMLRGRIGSRDIHLHEKSVLGLTLDQPADVVFSVGLIEHFDKNQTREAVLAHFNVLRPGGTAIITFPTPTLLYRMTRLLIESAGMWRFHDERPLKVDEVMEPIRERAEILFQTTLWPLLLTQHLIVARKRA